MMLQENTSFVKQKIIKPVKNVMPLIKSSWKMSWPMMVMMVFEFLMSMTDIYIAGLYGTEVKAATGLASQVYALFIMTGHALTIGAVSILSRLYTSEDKNLFKSAVFTSVTSAFSFGVIICIIGLLFSKQIVTLLNAENQVKDYASTLIKIYFLGIIFHMTLINMNGVLRSCKRVIITMGVMVFAALLNIILLLYFYNFTDIGYSAIAISTAISITSASIINIVIMYRIIDKVYKFSSSILKQILSIGWPGGVVSLSWQFGGTALYSILGMLTVNSTEIMAAYATGLRIESAIFMPAFAFNMANAVIVGNLMGEKKFDEAYKNGFVTAFISMAIVTVMMAVIIIFARPIAEMLEPNKTVVPEIIKYLYICMIAEPFIALNLAMGGALNGAGDTKATMRYAILNVWVLRLPLAYILGIFLGFGAAGIWWALNMGFFLQVILSTRRFMSKKWQKIEII